MTEGHTDIAAPQRPARIRPKHRAEALALGLIIGALMRLPYAKRVALMGWISTRLIAPVAGYRRRIRANLDHVFPDLPAARRAEIIRRVPDNMGRALIEQLSGAEFARHVRDMPLHGPGLAEMHKARAAGRPVILVAGHLGNHVAGIVALRAQGLDFGGFYMPLSNPLVNRMYVEKLEAFLNPAFPRRRDGMGAMLRFLRRGGMLGMLIDQHMDHGVPLDFLGRPARTALSAAEMALKFDALLVPGYAIRQADGLSFETVIEAPVPHSDPATMTQALNDSLSAQVRAHMDQWLWTHRRWKP
ncbi:MAG: lauroyl acyltransferase [Rhodobacteraceae bacterium]|nr:lauroyl acyltransferase [Paracoccaceae bacterium]